jgi:hypothetical protein
MAVLAWVGTLGGLASCNALLGLDDARIIGDDAGDPLHDSAAEIGPGSDGGARDGGATDASVDTAPCTVPADGDPHNCGACGHDCLGGTCVKGTCQPLVLASGHTSPNAIAVDDAYVYWVDDTSGAGVFRVPIDGGSEDALALAETRPFAIAVSPTHVYWGTFGGQLRRVPIGGGPLEPVAMEPSGQPIMAIALDAVYVYWTGGAPGVFRTPSGGGGSASPLVPGEFEPQGIAVSTTSAYWVTLGALRVVSLSGGDASTLVAGSGSCGTSSVALGGTNVFWTDSCSGAINRVPLGGGASTTLGTAKQPYAVAVDSAYVYWTDQNDGTRGIYRAPIMNGPTQPLLANQASIPYALAVDSRAIYWTSKADGTVLKLAKP